MADKEFQESVMPLAITKRMLGMAETDPLGCALGLTKDKKECLLLVEKTGTGKKIAAKLREHGKEVPLDATTVRFGSVQIKVPEDPGTVRFTINHSEAGGTIVALTRLAKKAGYQAVVINVDPDLEKDEKSGDAGDVAAPPATEPEPAAQAPEPAAQAPESGTAERDAAAAKLHHDLAALAARLAELIKRAGARIAAEPGMKDLLSALARDAQAKLKASDVAGATDRMDTLEAVLNRPSAAAIVAAVAEKAAETAPKGDIAKLTTSRLIWDGARKKIASEIDQYVAAVLQEFAGDEDEDEIVDALEQLDDILLNLDDRLSDTLDELLDERTSPAEHEKLKAEAIALLGEYEAYVASTPLVGRLEGPTPFGVTLTIGSTVDRTLKGLHGALR